MSFIVIAVSAGTCGEVVWSQRFENRQAATEAFQFVKTAMQGPVILLADAPPGDFAHSKPVKRVTPPVVAEK
jgi:hypothetical protein